jgi:hypothetical protein
MCSRYVAGLPDVGAGRGVNIPGFEAFGDDLLSVTRARHATWLSIVNDDQRPTFEANAAAAAAQLDASGALGRQVQADGIRAAVLDAATGARAGYVRAPPAPLYVAAWAHSPHATALDDYFLFNQLSEPLRAEALRRVLNSSAPASTDLLPYTFVDAPGSSAPSSVVYAPAWPAAAANSTYGVGIAQSTGVTTCTPAGAPASVGSALCALSFHWTSVRARCVLHACGIFLCFLIALRMYRARRCWRRRCRASWTPSWRCCARRAARSTRSPSQGVP